ncbi:hypothetical protein [Dictyobacter kobayashii]|uniref:Uncharacterized protein n=1 Tax=Dictyobacter kobayashii TaxID=2014872 RepID=A0A402AEQ2_9CHLR|nr:hypothetical protein [Dictyobacter kobayashii]GCE17563.1 hypothetical protein KDK_13630 [Dictyobacter kobayashii]
MSEEKRFFIDGEWWVTYDVACALLEKNSGRPVTTKQLTNFVRRDKLRRKPLGRQNLYAELDLQGLKVKETSGRYPGVYKPDDQVSASTLRVRAMRERRRQAEGKQDE